MSYKIGRINEREPISAIQKRNKRQKIKVRNQNFQQRDNIMLDTFDFQGILNEDEMNDMIIHDSRDEFLNRSLTNQPFRFKGKIVMVRKLVETIYPFKHNKAFENYLEPINEHHDEGSLSVQEADIFKETDGKLFNKVKKYEYGEGTNNIDEKVVRYQSKICYLPGEGLNCFLVVFWFFV